MIMIKYLAILLISMSMAYSQPTTHAKSSKKITSILPMISTIPSISDINLIKNITTMLHQKNVTLRPEVIEHVITTLTCAKRYHITNRPLLTIIDYSLPSNQKRLWVFDLSQRTLRFHTYVSHGIKSGALETNYFSNKYNSKASSIGVYKTDKLYYGREGISLQLTGLETNFNNNSTNRAIVMHGGWYMAEPFIEKYGRAGRSWGCPAVPKDMVEPIIKTIQDRALLIVYYPSPTWLGRSRFLHCEKMSETAKQSTGESEPLASKDDAIPRDPILFAALHKKTYRQENDPVVVMSAENYKRLVAPHVPVERMLRRQINQMEYIALSVSELNNLVGHQDATAINTLYFVIPLIKMVRGYYETEMHLVNLGKINGIKPEGDTSDTKATPQGYTVYFESGSSIHLKTSNEFIRWVGL